MKAELLSLEQDEVTGDLIVKSDLAGWKDESGSVMLLVYAGQDCRDDENEIEYTINETHNRIPLNVLGNQVDEPFQVCVYVSNSCGENSTFSITITGIYGRFQENM